MSPRALTALATFLALVPVTLLVPGLNELVVGAHGATATGAHAFMTVNMLAGMLVVPLAMRAVATRRDVHRWIAVALLVDAAAFAGMAAAPSFGVLMAFRVLDGAVHLPAVTMLMVLSNRQAGNRRGGALGALASSIMIGVAVGSPLGGWLVQRGPGTLYLVGSGLLVLAAVVASRVRDGAPLPQAAGGRYRWNRGAIQPWIPLAYGFLDRFCIGIFVSTFTLYLATELAFTPPQRGALVALFMVPFALLCYPAGRLADRVGWLGPMLAGNVLFGVVFASYGILPRDWMPVAMLASGVTSALMFAPNLLLVSDLARRGFGEGLFGAFQVAGSLGFLTGPVVGGILAATTANGDGVPAYRAVFAGVGALEVLLALTSWAALRRLAREVRAERVSGAATDVAPAVAS